MENFIIIPFNVGVIYLLGILIYRAVKWINGLSKMDKLRLLHSLKPPLVFKSIKESFVEGLLHRNIFKKNPVLGYMHMSLAFGWFLLIVVGHFEAQIAAGKPFVAFHKAVFFRYFETSKDFPFAKIFSFVMDLFLLFVISGLLLAIAKRFKKKMFGLRKTTRMKSGDRIALASLWLIFPLRLLAESSSAAIYHNGSFLTQTVGKLMPDISNPQLISFPLWVAYSLSLCFFFIALPNSRYMHIPGEIIFIFVRNAGIKLKKYINTYTDIQVYACSRCGICLDNCQLSTAGINDSQSVYLLKKIRNKNLSDEQLFNCLLCGKCQIDCPVGIDTVDLRITQRIESTRQYNSSYDYLYNFTPEKTDVVYFAGCMTHLTTGIVAGMKKIFAASGDKVWFMDEEKAPCCGRPLMLAGQFDAAQKLIENNTNTINASGAKKLVVSCPICYKVFKEDYKFDHIEVVFHADYILQLIETEKIKLNKTDKNFVYHDPCELGRGMGMYEIPRNVLNKLGNVIAIANEKETAYCCGGSLGNLKITQNERNILRHQAVEDYLTYKPDMLITACPMCKKTFTREKNIKVLDIVEVVTQNM